MADPLADLQQLPGEVGDVARTQAAFPAYRTESPADTAVRKQKIQRFRGADLADRNIPSYTDATGIVQPATDTTGAALTNFDKRNGIAYDSTGNPQKLQYGLTGAPKLSDPFEGVGVTTDKKTGDQYKITPGLPWKYVGQDTELARQRSEEAKQKGWAKESALWGGQASADAKVLHDAHHDLKNQFGDTFKDRDTFDPEAGKAAIDAHFASEAKKVQPGIYHQLFPEPGQAEEIQAKQAELEKQRLDAIGKLTKTVTLRDRVRIARERQQVLNQQRLESALGLAPTAANPAGLAADAPQAVAPAAQVPPETVPEGSDFVRGLKVSLMQLPALAHGTVALLGATAEKAVGEGGIASGVKQWGLKGYEDGMTKTQAVAHENDDVTKAWEKAKTGDLGALVDWAQYGAGYLVGQAGETVAIAALGGLAGTTVGPEGTVAGAIGGGVAKGASKNLIRTMVEKVVANAAANIEKDAVKAGVTLTEQQIRKQAVAAVGRGTAIAANSLMMEAGGIYPEAVKQAAAEGRELSGTDMAKIWATSIAAGGVDALTDKLGLDTALGKWRANGGGRISSALLTGAGLAGVEGGGEFTQTVLERLGAGQSLTDEEAQADYINSTAMGMLGGGVLGGGAAAFHGKPHAQPEAEPDTQFPEEDYRKAVGEDAPESQQEAPPADEPPPEAPSGEEAPTEPPAPSPAEPNAEPEPAPEATAPANAESQATPPDPPPATKESAPPPAPAEEVPTPRGNETGVASGNVATEEPVNQSLAAPGSEPAERTPAPTPGSEPTSNAGQPPVAPGGSTGVAPAPFNPTPELQTKVRRLFSEGSHKNAVRQEVKRALEGVSIKLSARDADTGERFEHTLPAHEAVLETERSQNGLRKLIDCLK